MASVPKPRYAPEQYLEIERKAEVKSEYFSGEMFAMAGGSLRHSQIAANCIARFTMQFEGRPCNAFTSDLRVNVSETGAYVYPDVSIICGRPVMLDEHEDTILNPSVILEVVSPSSEAYDRGEKFAHYRRLKSLTDYLLVSQDRVRIEQYSRQQDGQWLLNEIDGLEGIVEIPFVDCRLALADVYDKVEFTPKA